MNLIYLVVGGAEGYTEMLYMCLRTLQAQSARARQNTHVMVLCDEDYYPLVRRLVQERRVWIDRVMITGPNRTGMDACLRKLEIFSAPNIWEYEKVMYLDCDIIALGDVQAIFDAMDARDAFHVFEEKGADSEPDVLYGLHTGRDFSLGLYTETEIDRLVKEKRPVVNAGQYAFYANETMRLRFEELKALLALGISHEQAVLNHYIHRAYLSGSPCAVATLQPFIKIPYALDYEPGHPGVLVHFAFTTAEFWSKLHFMREMYIQFLEHVAGVALIR